MSGSRTVVVTGPLAAHAAEFDVRLAALGYARSTRTDVQVAAAELSRWLAGSGRPDGRLSDDLIAQFRGDCRARGVARPALGLTRLVTMLRSAGVLIVVRAAHPLTARDLLVAGYVDFLREERGLSPLSVEAYRSDVVRFLQRSGREGLHGLTHAEVSQAVLREVAGRSPSSVRRFGVALRSFLRYCFVSQIIDADLSASALPVSGRRRSLLPKGLTPSEAARLLRACDRRRAAGRRDYAVMLLMMRLGMRASEVASQ
jgi:integrase/recombinase XerD